jgi:hypothetical protein
MVIDYLSKTLFSGVSYLNEYRIKFEDSGSDSIPVPYSSVPFIVISSDVKECMYGPKRKRPEKVNMSMLNIVKEHFVIKSPS